MKEQLRLGFAKMVPGHAALPAKKGCICGWIAQGSNRRERQKSYTAHLLEMSCQPMRKCRRCRRKKRVEQMAIYSPGICKTCLTAKTKTWALEHPDTFARQRRNSHLKKRFGLTLDEFESMLISQGAACAICGTGTSDGGKSFHVDHDHKTGKVRGLLCGRCNRAIGQFADNPSLCRAAAAYLEKC